MSRTVLLVDDDDAVRDALTQVLEGAGLSVRAFASAEAFLAGCRRGQRGCLLLDVRLPGLSGPDLQAALQARGLEMPVIFLTGHGDVATSVRTLKAGAFDFLEKPTPAAVLLDRVRRALEQERTRHAVKTAAVAADARLGRLTAREREILPEVAAGRSSKEIARRLGISHRTVEVHRAHIMQKMGARNAVELARLAGTGELGALPARGLRTHRKQRSSDARNT
ncbi:MAG TPA: response regulator [Burkholderiales bacterium]|nr:response regulator [Burkholderiales bacterium]